MTRGYRKQSALLLETLRIAAANEVFALKGGTAINFFFHDCPRFSVDIDLCYLPMSEREQAFQDIRQKMEAIKSELKNLIRGAEVEIQGNCKALVRNEGVQVKIEVNEVVRGTLFPSVKMPLCPSLEKEFGVGMTVDCVAEPELYASKFCAALQRQHPRDIFDVWLFFDRGGEINSEFLDAFVIYLISHRKPTHEVLSPRIQDISNLYYHRFAGMTRIDTTLEDLLETQLLLPGKILSALTERHRTFLLSFNKGEPDWGLLPFPDAQNLPAVLWKQINLDKMSTDKHDEVIEKLTDVFKEVPVSS